MKKKVQKAKEILEAVKKLLLVFPTLTLKQTQLM